jgi:hypothetical protein
MTEHYWSEKYSAAFFERNHSLSAIRIDEAYRAILERAQEIPETSNERQKLDYAMKILSLLRESF